MHNKKSTELSKYGRTNIILCPLCLAEKVNFIKHFNGNRLLHKRNEFISGHQVKLLLKSFWWRLRDPGLPGRNFSPSSRDRSHSSITCGN